MLLIYTNLFLSWSPLVQALGIASSLNALTLILSPHKCSTFFTADAIEIAFQLEVDLVPKIMKKVLNLLSISSLYNRDRPNPYFFQKLS